MAPPPSSSNQFWETMNLLIGREFRRTGKEMMDDVQDWVEKVVVKREASLEDSYPEIELGSCFENNNSQITTDKEIMEYIRRLNLPKIECTFSHPHVTSRLEKLMGSNLVSLTDRDYMQRLQERILENYGECMDKRIRVREDEETERVKNLVLSGKIPLKQAPQSMAEHPVMLIERYCRRLIAERRAKIKIPKVHIPTYIYSDDTPDPPSGLSIENGHVFRKPDERLCNPISRFLPPEEYFDQLLAAEDRAAEYDGEEGDEEEEMDEEAIRKLGGDEEVVEEEEEDELMDECMFTKAEYDRLKYESPLIKQLRKCQTVEELYALADEIIGVLHTVVPEDFKKFDSAQSSMASSVKDMSIG